MNCTIKDIAKELDLSRNTVSKALNGSPGVSAETRKKIQEKAREMNYRQFLIDNSLSKPMTNQGSILFLTRASADFSEFWVKVMKGIESVLSENGYQLVLGVMNSEDLENLRFPAILTTSNIKGIIMVEICETRVCNALLEYNLPTVTVDMPSNYSELIGKLDIITMENKINVSHVVNKLIKKGYSRFAFAGDIYSENVGRGFKERYESLLGTLENSNLSLDIDCSFCYETEKDFMNVNYLADKIKKFPSLPQVYICGNDWTAIHLMHTIQHLGYKVPHDVSIVGFDNIPDSAKCTPSLTTIDTPKEHLGITAANCILQRIKDPKVPYVYSQYSTQLILRNSTNH